MSEKENAPIQIDFLVDARDLFRASIDVAKHRLLLGLGFSLALVTGLVIFFVIIDEKVILLQTSPLFIGLPLVAIGGQVLRMHAVCRKYVSSLSPSQRRMHYRFSDDAENYEVASGESTGRVSWNDVLKVVERPGYFLIFLNKFDVRLIPKKAIQPAEQAARLRRILVAKLGVRAKLGA
jgi:YcxB-like protein